MSAGSYLPTQAERDEQARDYDAGYQAWWDACEDGCEDLDGEPPQDVCEEAGLVPDTRYRDGWLDGWGSAQSYLGLSA